MLQAEAQMQAALAERTAASLAAGSNPHAVEGYVPRNSTISAPASASQANSKSESGTTDQPEPSTSSPQSESPTVEQKEDPHELQQSLDNSSVRMPGQAGKPSDHTQEIASAEAHAGSSPIAESGSAVLHGMGKAQTQNGGSSSTEAAQSSPGHEQKCSDGAKHEPEQSSSKSAEGVNTPTLNAESSAGRVPDASGVAVSSVDPAQQPILVRAMEPPLMPSTAASRATPQISSLATQRSHHLSNRLHFHFGSHARQKACRRAGVCRLTWNTLNAAAYCRRCLRWKIPRALSTRQART